MPDASDLNPAALPDPFLRLRAADIACPAPLFVDHAASVTQAARAMAAAGATAALARADDGTLGILTERDVLSRVVAAGLDPAATPVGAVMTRGLVTAQGRALLMEVFSRMVRHNIRRVVLVDEAGAPSGILGEGDMLAARGESPLALAAEIAAAAKAMDQEQLAACFRKLSRLAGRSVAEGIGSEAVGRLITEMHDRIMCGAWGLAAARTAQRQGPAPGPCALFVLGSQARGEQYLATDLDLALAHWPGEQGGPGKPGAAGEEWFAGLGEGLTRLLLDLGFPPCPKGIMPDNAQWRRGAEAWLDLADACAERPDAEAVVLTSLLADMRPLPAPSHDGKADDKAAELRRALLQRLAGGAVLLKFMAREAVRFSPPLGLFRGLSLTRDAAGKGSLDLKRGGVFAITQGAKVLAVELRLDCCGTRERLLELGRAGILTEGAARELCEAFDQLQTLRMRAQAGALRQGLQPGNSIRPEELPAAERERLRQAFLLVRDFQELISRRFALHLLA